MTPHIDVSASVDTSVLKIAIEHRLHWPLCMFITLGLCSRVITGILFWIFSNLLS